MFRKLTLASKAARQLGLGKITLYLRYQVGLRSGWYRYKTPIGGHSQPKNLKLVNTGIRMPWREDVAAVLAPDGGKLLRQSDQICTGQVRLFGGDPVDLNLTPSVELQHWTNYKSGQYYGRDIKLTWEPGRFGWATILARAYFVGREPKHARAFWESTQQFLEANPPNLGPHWASAQEVAIRLICLAFCTRLLSRAKESSDDRKAMLAETIAQHAARILPTLVYARAQNNNHLITEALGLYTAGVVLPDHPQAEHWRALGWKWFNRALQTQIAPDGAYTQHSTNYHRLMLQAALWGAALTKGQGQELPDNTRERLAAATAWLLSIVDHDTGRVPNLGPNDGAYILPFTVQPFHDYRPVLQAASQAFLGERPFPDGPWDEMGLWFGNLKADKVFTKKPEYSHRIDGKDSWAYLRAAKFTGRPGHADQLHLDLWWRGLNIAQDAGTYLYNGDPPWDNAHAGTGVHNTVIVGDRDQMTRARRFLWLDWSQAKVTESKKDASGRLVKISAQHNGYRKMGIIHRRTVEYIDKDKFEVVDILDGNRKAVQAWLHWLLPDWPWELNGSDLSIKSPHGWIYVSVNVTGEYGTVQNVQLIRAGELLAGEMLKGEGEVDPIQGWVSLTYGHKQPALSLSVSIQGQTPLQITSTWEFPSRL
jgi:hypothetical protein